MLEGTIRERTYHVLRVKLGQVKKKNGALNLLIRIIMSCICSLYIYKFFKIIGVL